MMTPRVAVTGTSGFCGGAIFEGLREAGLDVISIGRSKPNSSDCEHRTMMLGEPLPTGLLHKVDCIVHAAGLASDKGSRHDFMRTNVLGTRLLTETGVPMVFLSSASVYDGGSTPRSEDDVARPPGSRYGRSKLDAESSVLSHGGVVLRPRAVYGPGDTQLLPRIRAGVRRGRLIVPGNDASMSLTSVALLAAVVHKAINADPGTILNVADSIVYSRDRVLSAVLNRYSPGATLRHIPVSIARLAGSVAEFSSLPLSRYVVDQLANPVVLNTSRLQTSGFSVEMCSGNLAEFLDTSEDLRFVTSSSEC